MMELDPRTRLFLLFTFVVIVMVTQPLPVLAAEALLIAGVIAACGFMRAWVRILRTVVLMLVFLFAFYVWTLGLSEAVMGVLRLSASISAFFLFFQLTTVEDLGNALVQSRVPYPFVFVLMTAMQFAPVLSRQARDVFDAQRARGIRLEMDLASARNFPALLAPLLIQAFTLAEQLAEALEARGFGSPHRTFMREYRLRAVDWAAALCGVGALALAIVLLRQG
ncbi:MAG: energy-coupling factor transporter transmembrane protein EcfT [Chloroflexi bacterium]|nr:energy-coupling factor transporter transmembrane protein EcfT [Chloroflexota bacterium]MCL5274509.1 energy-coupling factor transporter transmembrane protein EcfT [Chloroflexota bacterium]